MSVDPKTKEQTVVEEILDQPMEIEGGGYSPIEAYRAAQADAAKKSQENDAAKAQSAQDRIQAMLTGRSVAGGDTNRHQSVALSETTDRPGGGSGVATKKDTQEWQKVKQREANDRYGRGG